MHVHLISNVSLSLVASPSPYPGSPSFAPGSIITIPAFALTLARSLARVYDAVAYDAAIRNWRSARSVTDAVALIALYIVRSCLVQREPAEILYR